MTVKTFKTWYIIHKWTSLLCTVFLLLLCLTGLPLIFSDDLAVWLGEAIEPPEHVTATAPVSLQALVSDARERRPLDHVKFLIRDEDHPAWFISLGTTPTAQENSALFMYDARTGTLLHDRPTNEGLGACPTLTFLLRQMICSHLRRARPEKILNVFSEYASGFSGPAASHLAASPSPRHERQCRTGS